MIRSFGAALVALVATAWADAPHAQSYPVRSVTLIVPPWPVTAYWADQVSKAVGRGILVVENRCGSAGRHHGRGQGRGGRLHAAHG